MGDRRGLTVPLGPWPALPGGPGNIETRYLFNGGLEGIDHLVAPTFDLVPGFADTAGVLDVPVTVPDLPVGDEALVGYCQPLVRAQGNDLRLGAPSHLLVLEASIPAP